MTDIYYMIAILYTIAISLGIGIVIGAFLMSYMKNKSLAVNAESGQFIETTLGAKGHFWVIEDGKEHPHIKWEYKKFDEE